MKSWVLGNVVGVIPLLESSMGTGMRVIPRYYCGNAIKHYNEHRGNCGDGHSIHGSAAGAVT